MRERAGKMIGGRMQRRNLGCKRKSGEKQKEWIWNAKQLTQETEKRIRARGKRGDCRIIT
jgi:hypothetical protein